ncbi:hypothetical protein GGQ97_001273 [Sphingomonas kaistensis]|uniref:Uncharacterized protein n=1 Tax=Sphingomonas kaistensis TaxID=298708 RepID=A0A7X6BGI1_9SPHN|nr:hypothetical protein [Sphingomonas kaistensis]NJC05480.1 hypothetical protein [Sphingomonas kaistensis]
MIHIVRAGLGAAALCLASASLAQAVGTSAMASTAPVMVRAGTMVAMTPMAEIASSKVKVGDSFEFTVVNDVVENGVVAVPRGAKALGMIKWKTGKAIGGKSGKFEIEFKQLTVNGKVVPLSGVHRQEGKGNTVGALLGSIWISGRSAIMTPGQIVNAMVAENTVV